MRLRRSLSFWLFQAILVLVITSVLVSTQVWASARCFGEESAADHPAAKVNRAAQSATFYKIQAGIEGEIFPVFANYASLLSQEQRSFGIVSVTITNSGKESLRQRVAVSVVGWSDEEIQLSEFLREASIRSTLLHHFCRASIRTAKLPRPRYTLHLAISREPESLMKPRCPYA